MTSAAASATLLQRVATSKPSPTSAPPSNTTTSCTPDLLLVKQPQIVLRNIDDDDELEDHLLGLLDEEEEEPLGIDSFSEASSLEGILQEPQLLPPPPNPSSSTSCFLKPEVVVRKSVAPPKPILPIPPLTSSEINHRPQHHLQPSAATVNTSITAPRTKRKQPFSQQQQHCGKHNSSEPSTLQQVQPLSPWTTPTSSSRRRDTILSLASTVSESEARRTKTTPSGSRLHLKRGSSVSSATSSNRDDIDPKTGAAATKVQLLRRLIMPDVEADDDVYSYKPKCGNKEKIYAVGSSVALVLGIIIACIVSSVHKIPEGSVGIYFKHGALQTEKTFPGVHWLFPFVTEMKEISIRPHTDTLSSIRAVTRDGILSTFSEVQVISDVKVEHLIPLIRQYGAHFKRALVFDRIREELRIFCANHTVDEVYNSKFMQIREVVKKNTEDSIRRLGKDAIQLLNLAIPKPEIPPDINKNYKQVKVQWTEQLVAIQQQRTESIKKDTESMKAVADANRQKTVLTIELEKQVMQKEGEKSLSVLENEIVKRREESNADVDHYKKLKMAEANGLLYTKEYVQLEMAKAMANNTKFYFSGENSVLGSLINGVMGRAGNN